MHSNNRFLSYINPIARLGRKKYSVRFPVAVSVLSCITLELLAYGVLANPASIGFYAIFVFVALIIYFSFRDGIRGGFLTTLVTITYYFYIMYSRGYSGDQLRGGFQTTLLLGVLYFIVSLTIGWLKQTIDALIEREADERRRLHAIIQQLPVGIVIADSMGVVTQGNREAERILGMKVPIGFRLSGKEVLIHTSQGGRKVSSTQSLLGQAIAQGRPILDKEYVIHRRDGKDVQVMASATLIHNSFGKLIAAVAIMADITTQKLMEQRKDDFVNMASHELKTPITSLKLYADSLRARVQKYNDPKVTKTIQSIRYQTDRLQKLVSDLLDVSRLQTGKLSFFKEEFDIGVLLQETVSEIQGAMRSSKMILTVPKGVLVIGDKFRIYQVVTNLITNAIKYSPQSEKIVIVLRAKEGKATISVQDFGIGIAKDQRTKIFERLYQVDDDTEKTFPGFGMGLYISKEIIRRHRGSIWVVSEKGKGSTFYFTLPCVLPTCAA